MDNNSLLDKKYNENIVNELNETNKTNKTNESNKTNETNETNVCCYDYYSIDCYFFIYCCCGIIFT
jgi:hypothetical protein